MEEIGPVKTDWTVLTSEIKQTQQSAEEQNQVFKPQNRTITVEIGQKTNVAGF